MYCQSMYGKKDVLPTLPNEIQIDGHVCRVIHKIITSARDVLTHK